MQQDDTERQLDKLDHAYQLLEECQYPLSLAQQEIEQAGEQYAGIRKLVDEASERVLNAGDALRNHTAELRAEHDEAIAEEARQERQYASGYGLGL